MGDRHIGAAAHGFGGSGEQRFHLEVVDLCGIVAEIAVGLVVEILLEIARQILRIRFLARLAVTMALLALHDLRDVPQVIDARQRTARFFQDVERRGIKARFDIAPILRKQLRHRARHRGERGNGMLSLPQNVEAFARRKTRGEIMYAIKGDARRLQSGEGKSLGAGCVHEAIMRSPRTATKWGDCPRPGCR